MPKPLSADQLVMTCRTDVQPPSTEMRDDCMQPLRLTGGFEHS